MGRKIRGFARTAQQRERERVRKGSQAVSSKRKRGATPCILVSPIAASRFPYSSPEENHLRGEKRQRRLTWKSLDISYCRSGKANHARLWLGILSRPPESFLLRWQHSS